MRFSISASIAAELRRAVEGNGEVAAGAAGSCADRHAAERHRAGRKADLAGADALVADRDCVFGQQARDDQRAAAEISSGSAKVTSASRSCGPALTVFSGRVTDGAIAGQRRRIVLGGHVDGDLRRAARAGAAGVGHLDGQRPARRRGAGRIGIGQVLDQRLDGRRIRRAVQGDGEAAAGAAGGCADLDAAEPNRAGGKADLAGAAALVADRHGILGQQARDNQRAATEIGVGEADVRSEKLRGSIDGAFEQGEGRYQAGQRRGIVFGGHVDGDRAVRAGAAGVGDRDGQRSARRWCVGRVGIGQVLDQRLDRCRIRRAIEVDCEIAASAAGNRADRHAAERHRPARKLDLTGANALAADRHRVLGEHAGDHQRAACVIVVRIDEGDVRVEKLRGGVDGVFEEGDGRRQAGQRRGIVLGGHVDGDLGCAARVGAFGVGHFDRQGPARRRRVGGIRIGQVLDQRLDRRRIRRAVEGDGEIAADAAGNSADRNAAVRHRAARQPDLAGAVALVADRHRVLGQQARDDQRAAAEIVFRIAEADVRVEKLRRRR